MPAFPSDRLRYYCILVGGFLGPFAAQCLAVVLPEFASDFGITMTQASLTMTAYSFPFAVMMLFSGYLVRNIRPDLVVRVAFVTIAACAVVLLTARAWWIFLAAYVVAGLCNAFTLPSLQLILRHVTPDEKLGTALGSYAAMQSLGLLSAPLVAGSVVTVGSWRWSFVAILVFPLAIALIGLPRTAPSRAASGSFTVNWPLVRGCLTLFALGVSTIGMGFLISNHVGELFEAPPFVRGLIVMVGGLSAFLFSSRIGGVADRRGPRPLILAALCVAACAWLGIAFIPVMVVVAVLWGVVVTSAQGVQVGVNLLILRSPSGAQLLSTVQAFRFFGGALTPVLILPLYNYHHVAGLGTAAAALVTAAALNAAARRR